MAHVRIQLLGDFRIFNGDQPHHRGPQTRQQGLLAYLLVQRQGPVHRQKVAAAFWPDSGKDQARSNLRTALARLQQDLPWLQRFLAGDPLCLYSKGEWSFQVDVVDFEAALQAAEQLARSNDTTDLITLLRRAVALYRGDFLPHLYDDWVLSTQERLRNLYRDALEWLIVLLQEQADYSAAIHYAQQLVGFDPLSESAGRYLIELHAQHGDRASAVRAYRTLAQRLQRELGVEPSPTTQALYQRLISDDRLGLLPPVRQSRTLLTRFAALWQQPASAALAPSTLAGLLKLAARLLDQGAGAEAATLLHSLEPTRLTATERGWTAEIHRLRGQLAWQQGEPAGLIEGHFQRALAVAQQEQAPWLLLRTAVTLVCYRQERNPGGDPVAQIRTLAPELSPFFLAFSWAELQSLGKLLE